MYWIRDSKDDRLMTNLCHPFTLALLQSSLFATPGNPLCLESLLVQFDPTDTVYQRFKREKPKFEPRILNRSTKACNQDPTPSAFNSKDHQCSYPHPHPNILPPEKCSPRIPPISARNSHPLSLSLNLILSLSRFSLLSQTRNPKS